MSTRISTWWQQRPNNSTNLVRTLDHHAQGPNIPCGGKPSLRLTRLIEVRDSRSGCLVPGRDGPGLLPDWESCWDAAAAAVTWKLKLTFWPGNYIWSFQIGFWHIWELSEFWYRGSTQNFEPDWSSIVIWPGEPFWKTCLFSKYFQK